MTHITEAIFVDGALRPSEPLPLRQHERVRLIVQPIDAPRDDRAREHAIARLRAGIASMTFRSNGPYPTRDELHERR